MVSLVTLAVAVALMGLMIVRNLLKQLGGEPAYAADVCEQVAAGNLTVDIATRPGDNSNLLFSLKTMVGKLFQHHPGRQYLGGKPVECLGRSERHGPDHEPGASEQAASVERTTASVEEMSASISQNSENTRTAKASPRSRPRKRAKAAAP